MELEKLKNDMESAVDLNQYEAENEAENEVNDAVKKDAPNAEGDPADQAEDSEFTEEIKVEKLPSDEPEPPKDDEPDMDAESLEKYRRFISLGLTPDEAFRATGYRKNPKKTMATSPISVTSRAISISEADLRAARQIFTTLTDREINNLYRRVTE